ncbi:Molybdopterin synthase catalytic subunit [Atta colombica]|uniref:Molybdopterin synthase catalytic subunit n=1 Tax=Atta colombica TaxID=520822 RepID=A0A195BJ07_9HYME|nr:Molybdopterin synthase catalytic subunit [Atta colombica]
MDKTEIQATILFFAKARELVGSKECKLSIQKKLSSADLFDKIVHAFDLESIRNQIILAVNDEFVVPNSILILSENDKIAVIPPLSGGLIMEILKNFVKLQQEELNIAEIMELVTFPNCGAISNFIGITRDNFENKKVIKLEYEAYESMALKEMTNICNKIRSQWDVEGIAIYHRIGEVPISKASVVIAVSSPHREQSLRAVEYAINALKASVPIWKKEVYETGEPQWKQNKECNWINRANYFSNGGENNGNENSCARVDAILIRRKDSRSHIKVHRVLNEWGPQTIDQSILCKPITNNMSFDVSDSFPILDERISVTERMIGINKPVPKDIYERLKNIEDRILYLESISPEYKDFWTQ